MIKLKHILTEGRYDQTVKELSTDIFNAIKNGDTEWVGSFTVDNKTTKTQKPIEVDVDIVIKYLTRFKWSHSISALGDENDIEAIIKVNTSYMPMAYNDLLAEIKEMLRHEIEHVTQYNFRKGKVRYQEAGTVPFKQYLLLKHEVPAYVQGLYKRAKTKRMTVPQAMEEWYTENGQNFNSPSEWQEVKKVWLDWGKKNLPMAQWSEQ
jgi:hypothetical protein